MKQAGHFDAIRSERSTPDAPATPRTSAAHPLQIASINPGEWSGKLGVTICPGKQGDSVFGAPWGRDLKQDLDVIRDWGAAMIITLVEAHELKMLGVPDLGPQVRERGIEWRHLPIADMQAPGSTFNAAWPSVSLEIQDLLRHGQRVLVHCRGGLGRAGTVAACVLIDCGVAPGAAIAQVCVARTGAIETSSQERYVLGYRAPQP